MAALGISKSIIGFDLPRASVGEEPQTVFLQGPARTEYAVLLGTAKDYCLSIAVPSSRLYAMKQVAGSCLRIIQIVFGTRLLEKLAKKKEETVEVLDLLFKNLIFKDFANPATCTHQTLFNMLAMAVSTHFSEKLLVSANRDYRPTSATLWAS